MAKEVEVMWQNTRKYKCTKPDAQSGKKCGRFQNWGYKQSIHPKYFRSGKKWQIIWQNKWKRCEQQTWKEFGRNLLLEVAKFTFIICTMMWQTMQKMPYFQ
ncbi:MULTISPECIES: hypothetical protein [Bacteroides]|uniref:hypothetical protein n=1 Tax=Bacteroidales TaxID=171549 RepID=UPI0015B778D2